MLAIDLRYFGRRCVFATLLLASALSASTASAQKVTEQAVFGQIGSLLQEKEARSASQQKIGSQLWYALQASRGQALPGLDDLYASATSAAAVDAAGLVKVQIRGAVTRGLLRQIANAGGVVQVASGAAQSIVATLPLGALEALAANADVRHIAHAPRARTNVGALTSQGYISHKANLVVASGRDGSGVKVGVLSDSVDALAAMISSGDIPPDAVVVPGQSGVPGTSEGTAMMEIVHDLAPGAKLFFASAFASTTSFADNIRTLRNVYGCDIIVDDVSYSGEGVFQDGDIARAVNEVTASGALYFSSAGNAGNLTSGTAGVWEGDFNAGPASAAPLPLGYTLHIFSGAQAYNRLATGSTLVGLSWSDPLSTSTNDYDLFLLNAGGTAILCAATDVQAGAQDPYEECYSGNGYPAQTRIVVAKKAAAAPRALHVDSWGSTLTLATSGATSGHNAGASTVTTAAVAWNSARTGTRPFVGGAANPTEVFSSDGPRKIFYQPDGTPITPGNFLFGSNGGTTLNKPDIAAADGAVSHTPGFQPFFGTSAAAPHAAAIAALIKQARPDYTNAQILNAMKQTALDIRAAGVDRDSGWGIVMAWEAVNYALTH